MIDQNKLWSCIGSAGVVAVTDLTKVDFVGPIVRLHGIDIIGPAPQITPNIEVKPALVFPQIQAVIRYGVTPVDGLSLVAVHNVWDLHVYCRPGSGHVQVRLMEVALPRLGVSAPVSARMRAEFDSTSASNPQFTTYGANPIFGPSQDFDFVNNGYYIEATLSVRSSPFGVFNPPALALIQILQRPEQP